MPAQKAKKEKKPKEKKEKVGGDDGGGKGRGWKIALIIGACILAAIIFSLGVVGMLKASVDFSCYSSFLLCRLSFIHFFVM